MRMLLHRPMHGGDSSDHIRRLQLPSEAGGSPDYPGNTSLKPPKCRERRTPGIPSCNIWIPRAGTCCQTRRCELPRERLQGHQQYPQRESQLRPEVQWASFSIRKEIPPHHRCHHDLVHEPAGRTTCNNPVLVLSGCRKYWLCPIDILKAYVTASLDQVDQPDVPVEIVLSHKCSIVSGAKEMFSTAKFRQ